jgi:hypothetical protein
VYEAFSVQVQLCKRHYEEWLLKYFFRAPPLLLSKEHKLETGESVRISEPDVCFRKLILGNQFTGFTSTKVQILTQEALLGHPSSLSQLSNRSPQFATNARVMRDHVLLGLPSRFGLERHDAHNAVHQVTFFVTSAGSQTLC